MARKRWKKTGAIRFVAFQHWMLKTPAYRHACPGERAALVELYALYNASNNGHLYLSVRELAARLGVTEKPAQKYLNGLVAKGFIKPKVKGSFTCKTRKATTWTLTEFGTDQDIKATVDFMKWRPGDDFTPDAEKKTTVGESPTDGGKNYHRNADLSPEKSAHGGRKSHCETNLGPLTVGESPTQIDMPYGWTLKREREKDWLETTVSAITDTVN